MNLALINPKVWLELALAAAIAFGLWYVYNWIYDRGALSVQVQWNKEKQSIAEQSAKIASDALATTKALTETIDQQRNQTNAQISALNASLGSAITGLRNRPARDGNGGVPINPSTGTASGATGADLLRQDGEFLARESARADKLRLQLIQCQNGYNSARDAVK